MPLLVCAEARAGLSKRVCVSVSASIGACVHVQKSFDGEVRASRRLAARRVTGAAGPDACAR
eukprot:6176800-Pleurochrysis_carterae.AAC.3